MLDLTRSEFTFAAREVIRFTDGRNPMHGGSPLRIEVSGGSTRDRAEAARLIGAAGALAEALRAMPIHLLDESLQRFAARVIGWQCNVVTPALALLDDTPPVVPIPESMITDNSPFNF